ncbi:hypothetical protein LCGC14_1914590 [marine sediment metagenome]|uniref:Class I SAM-dependent methyltransferase n=1 Tax=marine sediment metagenome TaxID=412755 RepID=A0A0F9FSF5_9ZZZZ
MSFGSHVPMLLKCFEQSDGPVLEMGTGIFSTPILDMLCKQRQKRHILSLENDPKWFAETHKEYQSPYHDVVLVQDWDNAPIEDKFWGLALVDHRPKNRRRVDILRLKYRAYFVIIHDSQPDSEQRHYRYHRIYDHFRYRYDFTECLPHTTVLSNYNDLGGISWET